METSRRITIISELCPVHSTIGTSGMVKTDIYEGWFFKKLKGEPFDHLGQYHPIPEEYNGTDIGRVCLQHERYFSQRPIKFNKKIKTHLRI